MSAHSRSPSDASRSTAISGTSPCYDNGTRSGSSSRASFTARLATSVYGSPVAGQGLRVPPSDRSGTQTPLAGAGGGSLPGPGTSSLSQALRGSLGKSPSRHSTPPAQSPLSQYDRTGSPSRRGAGGHGPGTPRLAGTHFGPSPRGTEDIEILRRHLVGPSQAGSEAASPRRVSNMPSERLTPSDQDFSSLQLQGGDTTRHIYRYAEKREREQAEAERRAPGLRRSLSVNLPKADVESDAASVIHVPGGFRRDHIRRTAVSPAPSSINPRRRPDYGMNQPAFTGSPAHQQPQFIANNFIEFLTLYGHFAGEELDEDDDELEADEYFSSGPSNYDTTEAGDGGSDDGHWGENSALLTPGKRKRRRQAREAGKGTPTGAALLLLKSFVGTGVLFLPRAFLNGGMLFSNLVLLFIAVLSYYCFILLVATRLKIHASFGDMGLQTYGPWFRNLINFSLVISQIGFASAYIVFVSENLQAFILAVSNCKTHVDIKWVILMQMIIFLPLSLYRNINNIQKLALVADLFILLGLIYLYFYDIKTIVDQRGISDIQNFNPKGWTLFIGTAIFTFEGIGLIIPIQSSMKEPKKFPKVLASVMVVISVVFISMGALSYAAYGSKTKTVIILNMPQDNKLVNGVQFIYSLAILFSTPLQIYPAIEITSQQIFSKTGKYNSFVKWQKNIFRFFMVVLCAAIAWAGANDLDKFVALVGSFACIPLVYIYPPMMHYRVMSVKLWEKSTDVVLVVFGLSLMGYTTALTIMSWVHGGQVKPPSYCDDR